MLDIGLYQKYRKKCDLFNISDVFFYIFENILIGPMLHSVQFVD